MKMENYQMTGRIDFNVAKDGFSAHFYPGSKKRSDNLIIYTGCV